MPLAAGIAVLIDVLLPLFIIGSIIWVGVDSARVMRGLSKEQRKGVSKAATSPAGWVIGCIFLWIIALPWYLARRGKYVEVQRKLLREAQ